MTSHTKGVVCVTRNGQRITITVSEENLSWLDANYNNRSGYIDDLLTNAREGNGEVSQAIRQYQIEQLESEISGMKAQVETKASRLESLKAEQQSQKQEQQRKLEDAKETLGGKNLPPDNPAVKKWAEKCDMTPEELLEELDE